MIDVILSNLHDYQIPKQKAFSMNEFGSNKAEGSYYACIWRFLCVIALKVGRPGCFTSPA
jgi:hypothetical protein